MVQIYKRKHRWDNFPTQFQPIFQQPPIDHHQVPIPCKMANQSTVRGKNPLNILRRVPSQYTELHNRFSCHLAYCNQFQGSDHIN